MTTFVRTRLALEHYDKDQGRRDHLIYAAKTNEDVAFWELEEKLALSKVQRAFWLDTKHINSKDKCRIAGIDFMRKCANRE